MTKTQIIALLSELGVRPSRKLGQNFLVDTNLLEALVRDANPAPDDLILEVGAGTGELTRGLLERGCRVAAVELDRRLVDYLTHALGENQHLTLVAADACALDYDSLMGDVPYRCIANLPYACSSVVVANLAAARNPPVDMHLLLQREMARRLCAVPGTKDYGSLSVRVQLLYDVARLRSVPPEVFFPQPRVMSMFIRLTRHDRYPADVRHRAADLARQAFSQRRKKLVKVLEPRFGRTCLRAACERSGIDANARAESVSVDGFAALASVLNVSLPAS